MATVARSFSRVALSCTRHTAPRPAPVSCACSSSSVTQLPQHRKFSVTPLAFNQQDGEGEAQASPATSGDLESAPKDGNQMSDDARHFQSIRHTAKGLERKMKKRYIKQPKPFSLDDPDQFPARFYPRYNDDALYSFGHMELEQHREIREYARIAAWDMPSLINLAKPFVPPAMNQPLRFRYTTYLGEPHPAETKVVMEVCSKDLTPSHLTEAQRITLLKLVGPRYNPDKDLIHMSCEQFPTRAQNKRYLGDLIENLIKEAKEGDSFADVPLDLRHHKPKPKYAWPKEWNMTEKRKAELEMTRNRNQKLLGTVTVDGNMAIDEAIAKIPALSSVLAPKAGGTSASGRAKLGKPNHRQRGR